MFTTLLQARKELGATQQDFAAMLGVSRNYVALIECGNRPCPAAIMAKANEIVASAQQAVLQPPATTHPPPPAVREDPPAYGSAYLDRAVADLSATVLSQSRQVSDLSAMLAKQLDEVTELRRKNDRLEAVASTQRNAVAGGAGCPEVPARTA